MQRRALLLSALVAAAPLAALAEDRLKVVTTFTVIADMARNVAGEGVEIVSVTKPGAEIHGYEPTPQDIVAASDADLILWNGLGLERWFEQFLGNLGDVPSVTLTDGIQPISILGGAYEGKPNPHAWMSLDNALVYVDNIAKSLSQADPDNAALYAANADRYKAQLLAEIGPLKDRIASLPADRRWLVTCEGAFSYLARDLGLQELYLWPINADQRGNRPARDGKAGVGQRRDPAAVGDGHALGQDAVVAGSRSVAHHALIPPGPGPGLSFRW